MIHQGFGADGGWVGGVCGGGSMIHQGLGADGGCGGVGGLHNPATALT